jgi:hypothetical protein
MDPLEPRQEASDDRIDHPVAKQWQSVAIFLEAILAAA